MSATKPSFSKTEFLDLHPRLYHMAADGTWPSIQRYGLLSTSAVLDLASIKGEERVPLERQRRMEGIHVPLGGEPGEKRSCCGTRSLSTNPSSQPAWST